VMPTAVIPSAPVSGAVGCLLVAAGLPFMLDGCQSAHAPVSAIDAAAHAPVCPVPQRGLPHLLREDLSTAGEDDLGGSVDGNKFFGAHYRWALQVACT
jgi:hypothetical protein